MAQRWRFDPSRQVAQLVEPTLHHLVLHSNYRYATLSEYAHAAALDTTKVASAFAPLVESGVVAFELAGSDVFVLTAPHGRPGPRHLPEIAPNLWERLRRHVSAEAAYALWQVVRDLERAGWEVEADPYQVAVTMGPLLSAPAPCLGVYVHERAVPLAPYPALSQLSSPGGLLEAYSRAEAPALAVTVASGMLESAVTAVRTWALTRPVPSRLAVLVLEAPQFAPVVLSSSDPAVRPVAVDRLSMRSWLGD